MATTFARLCQQVDITQRHLEEEIARLSKEIDQLEKIQSNSKFLRYLNIFLDNMNVYWSHYLNIIILKLSALAYYIPSIFNSICFAFSVKANFNKKKQIWIRRNFLGLYLDRTLCWAILIPVHSRCSKIKKCEFLVLYIQDP